MKKEAKLHAVVAPKQKKVNIMMGNKVIKVYKFKMDIPSKKVRKPIFVHDYGERCVSDRDYIVWREETEYDKPTMDSIRDKSLAYYNSHNQLIDKL